MGWMRVRSTALEIVICLIVTFMMFRPDWFMNHIEPKYVTVPAEQVYEVAANLDHNQQFVVQIEGLNIEGDELSKTVAVPLAALPEDSDLSLEAAGRQRLAEAGVGIMAFGDMVQISSVRFGSQASRSGWETGWDVVAVQKPNPDRPSEYLMYLPALLLLFFIWWRQGIRLRTEPQPVLQAGQSV